MSDPTYKLSAPVYFVGDRVAFYDREVLRLGEIRWIETHYTPDHQGYHNYHIKGDGLLRRRLVGEDRITGHEQAASSRPGPMRYARGSPAYVRGIDD